MHESEILRIFEANRPHLMGLAYRMSGSVTDAEDAIQDTWLRWQHADHAAVACPKAYLLRVTMRLCLDRARSASARRELYVGPWLPEPIVDLAQLAADPSPQSMAERVDDLSVALLLVLERLSPLERAAFLLHDVFDFSFDEIAATLGRAPAACRKLASRARQRIRQERPAKPVPPALARQFAARFHQALQSGDLVTFAEMLAEDAVLIADGGGKKYAALKPIHGRDRIVRFLVGIASKFGWPKEIRRLPLNASDGFAITEADGGLHTWSLDWSSNGRVKAIYLLRNPDKLRHLQSAMAVREGPTAATPDVSWHDPEDFGSAAIPTSL
jgi:RNA polymerase sigma-70 factor (ECF subfamily)